MALPRSCGCLRYCRTACLNAALQVRMPDLVAYPPASFRRSLDSAREPTGAALNRQRLLTPGGGEGTVVRKKPIVHLPRMIPLAIGRLARRRADCVDYE